MSAESRESGSRSAAADSTGPDYDAFISYSHAADGQLAPALQDGLQRFAKPWRKRRALRVFRDDTGLAVNAALWPSIEASLGDSGHFILLASPDAAHSEWVNREVSRWVELDRSDRLLPVVTEGGWVWDAAANDFDWAASSAVPPSLRGVFSEEPRHLDLRWARTKVPTGKLDLRNSDFRAAVADLAAPIHGLPKDELEGQDLREHKKAQRLRRIAIVALMFLALGMGVAAIFALANASEARRQQTLAEESEAEAVAQAELATSRQLAAQAVAAASDELDLSLLLALNALAIDDNAGSRGALLSALEANPALVAYLAPVGGVASAIASSRDGQVLAVGDSSGAVQIFDFAALAAIGRADAPMGEQVTALALTDDAGSLAVGTVGGDVSIWALGSASLIAQIEGTAPVSHLAFDAVGDQIAIGRDSADAIEVWDLSGGAPINRTGRLEAPIGVELLSFAGPDRLMVFGSFDLEWRDLTTGAIVQTWRLETGGAQSGYSAHAPDGSIGAYSTLDRGNIGIYKPGPESQFGAGITVQAGAIDRLEWEPGGSVLAVAQEGRIGLWNAAGNQLAVMAGAESAIVDFAFGEDANRLASLGNGKVQVWDPGARSRLGRVAPVTKVDVPNAVKRVVNLDFSPDGGRVAWVVDPGGLNRFADEDMVGEPGTTTAIWDPTSGHVQPVATGSLPLYVGFVAPDVIATSDGEEGEAVATWVASNGSPASVEAGCVPTGTGSMKMTAGAVVDLVLGEVVFERCPQGTPQTVEVALPEGLPSGSVEGMVGALAADGSALVIVDGAGEWMATGAIGADKRVEALEVVALDPPAGFAGPPFPFVSPAGSTVLLTYGEADATQSTAGRQVSTVWDLRSGGLKGLLGPAAIDDVAFSPDESLLAVALSSGAIEIRDGRTLQIMTTLPGDGDGRIRTIEFSPDGSMLGETSTGGRLILWDLDIDAWVERACRIAGRYLTVDERNTFLGAVGEANAVGCTRATSSQAAVSSPPPLTEADTATATIPPATTPPSSTAEATTTVFDVGDRCFDFGLDPASPEIRFDEGSFSGVVEGALVPGTADQYRIGAGAGQSIEVDPGGPFLVCLQAPDGFFVAEIGFVTASLPATQEYFVTVIAIDGGGSYRLEVTII